MSKTLSNHLGFVVPLNSRVLHAKFDHQFQTPHIFTALATSGIPFSPLDEFRDMEIRHFHDESRRDEIDAIEQGFGQPIGESIKNIVFHYQQLLQGDSVFDYMRGEIHPMRVRQVITEGGHADLPIANEVTIGIAADFYHAVFLKN